VAQLVVDVLSATSPGTNKAGAPSKATYRLQDGVADKTKAASAEMLDRHPLYPGLELS
jgi:glycine hydroxymethyltransferase